MRVFILCFSIFLSSLESSAMPIWMPGFSVLPSGLDDFYDSSEEDLFEVKLVEISDDGNQEEYGDSISITNERDGSVLFLRKEIQELGNRLYLEGKLNGEWRIKLIKSDPEID